MVQPDTVLMPKRTGAKHPVASEVTGAEEPVRLALVVPAPRRHAKQLPPETPAARNKFSC